MTDSFKARTTLNVGERSYEIFSLQALPQGAAGATAVFAEDPAGEPAAL